MTTSDMHSQEIGTLLEALAKAQAVMQGAIEDSSNPFFKSKYADLTSIWEACRRPLTQNGLSVVQTIQIVNGTNCLVTILGHASGQWIKSMLPINPAKPDIQALGSAITYCRRYALSAIAGVCPIDDDGESAMDRSKKESVEDDEPIALTIKIPEGISKDSVEKYISESALVSGKSKNHIIQRANNNPEGFFDQLKKWSTKDK